MKVLPVIKKRAMYFIKKTSYEVNFHFSNKSGLSKKTRKVPLIVSLTSYPARYKELHLTLTSLLTQSIKPDKVILWLAKSQRPEDKFLKKWKNLTQRGVLIKYVDGNIRSYKKLIYTVKEFPEAIIVTVDDETMYPRDLIEILYNKHLEHTQSIVGTRCTYMTKVGKKQIAAYRSWAKSTELDPSYSNFVTGVGGVLYPPGSLHKEVLNFDAFLRLAPSADDIWFKAMGLLNKTKTVPVRMNQDKLVFSKASQSNALWHTNVTQDKNSEQLEKVFDIYNLYKYIK